jgi:hypothetical protein
MCVRETQGAGFQETVMLHNAHSLCFVTTTQLIACSQVA